MREFYKMQYSSTKDRLIVNRLSKGLTLIICIAIVYSLLLGSVNVAMGQAPYLSSKVILVPMNKNATASVYCNDGDGLISGGYSIIFSSRGSAFDTSVYSNHPIQEINQTGYFEGWEAALENRANATAKISAFVLCLNLTLTR